MKVEEISQYISQLEKQLSSATKHSETLVKRNKDMSQALFEFGQSISVLGQAEGDAIGTGLSMVRKNIFSCML
jgi:DNA repair exonuclease SbcCD ATPase subunit